jgi:hypothetical protein
VIEDSSMRKDEQTTDLRVLACGRLLYAVVFKCYSYQKTETAIIVCSHDVSWNPLITVALPSKHATIL